MSSTLPQGGQEQGDLGHMTIDHHWERMTSFGESAALSFVNSLFCIACVTRRVKCSGFL